MMEHFWIALAAACRDDATLVTLVGEDYANGDLRIGRSGPNIPAKYPFLAFSEDDNGPGIEQSVTDVIRTVVAFECMAEQEVDAIKIADQITNLLLQTGEEQNVKYWDISDTDVLNHMTLFLSRQRPEHDKDTKRWTAIVIAEFKWCKRVQLDG